MSSRFTVIASRRGVTSDGRFLVALQGVVHSDE